MDYKISPEAIANGINDLLDELEEEKRINKENLKLIDDLQNKIDSAIEYIENHTYDRSDVFVFKGFYPDFYIEKVLDILKGSDSNED